jgi:hypothetical protein
MYVHQSRVNFKGSPHDFFQLAQSFAAQTRPAEFQLHAAASNAACR